jgi:hypothetical protein
MRLKRPEIVKQELKTKKTELIKNIKQNVMKTTIVKNSMITLILIFFSVAINAQKTYLKITKSNEANDYEMYPPGTKFELKTKEGYIIFKNSDDPGLINITEKHTLYVYPNWKDDADVFVLTEGKVEKVLTSTYVESDSKKHRYNSNGVTADYKVTDSKDRKGKKNLNFKLSNGITFIYEDDKYRAFLNEPDNYIRIKGKYVIESEIGSLKLSFNPSNGVVWWVFDASETQNNLLGEWKIDLRPTPDSPEYYQTLNIIKIDGKNLEGTFYGSPIKSGFINTEWEKTYFSFTTSDASNDYYHSGYILDGKLYGISYCPNRKLTAPWTGALK